MSIENPTNKRSFLKISDWMNELISASNITEKDISDDEWQKRINSSYYKETFKLRNLDERYKERSIRDGVTQVIDDEYYIKQDNLKTEEEKELFFAKKKLLDDLVSNFNQEIKKQNPSREIIKSLNEKMWNLIRN